MDSVIQLLDNGARPFTFIFFFAYDLTKVPVSPNSSRGLYPSALGPDVKTGSNGFETIVNNYYQHKIKLTELRLGMK